MIKVGDVLVFDGTPKLVVGSKWVGCAGPHYYLRVWLPDGSSEVIVKHRWAKDWTSGSVVEFNAQPRPFKKWRML